MNDPYSGKPMWGDLITDFLNNFMMMKLMNKMYPNKDEKAAGRAEGMASMMPNRPLEQAQPMVPQSSNTLPQSNLDPQTMQMLMQLLPLMQSQYRR